MTDVSRCCNTLSLCEFMTVALCNILWQLYWGAKSEMGEVVVHLRQAYSNAKRDALPNLQDILGHSIVIAITDDTTVNGLALAHCYRYYLLLKPDWILTG